MMEGTGETVPCALQVSVAASDLQRENEPHGVLCQGIPLPWMPGGKDKRYRTFLIRVFQDDGFAVAETRVRFSRFVAQVPKIPGVGKASHLLPSRGTWWTNYTTDEINVKSRALAMQKYLVAVLNDCGVNLLECPILHSALDISDTGCARLQRVAAERRREIKVLRQALEAQMQELQKQRQEQQAQRRAASQARKSQVDALWRQAQTLNVTNTETRQRLRYGAAVEFEINAVWFTGGDEAIHGPYNRSWLRLRRTDYPRLSPFADLTYQLCTMAGVPLLEVKELFRPFDHACEICYVTAQEGVRVQAARVHREWQLGFISEEYQVTGLGCNRGHRFVCAGPAFDLLLQVDGRPAAKVYRHLFSLSQTHTVQVSPQQDILLVLGICCAICRIHAAIQRESS